MENSISILVIASSDNVLEVHKKISLIDPSLPKCVVHRADWQEAIEMARRASGPQKIIFVDPSLIQTEDDERAFSTLAQLQDEKMATHGGGHVYWIDAGWQPDNENPPLGIPLHTKECSDLLEAFHLHGHVKVV